MLIELQDVTYRYSNSHKPVLDKVSLSIHEGTSLSIAGPSGSGKSTLLNLLGTLDFPTSGEVLLNGISTRSYNGEGLVNIRNKDIGFIFQTHMLLPQLTVIENILLPVLPSGKNKGDKACNRAMDLLDTIGLTGKIHSYPGEMSVGECQRVAVVRALINEPQVILADEPTGSLDKDTAETLIELLIRLKEEHRFTLIAVTHSQYLAERMEFKYRLVNGKLMLA
jgi:ABC-type lipoprotein export system ATPase subunit